MKETLKEIRALFANFLAERSLRMTAQRNVILTAFLESEKHISTDELYMIVRKLDKSIGYATVYRTLKLLTKSDIAAEVNFEDGIVRYENKYLQQHHDHLICDKCGKKVEVFDERIETLQEELAGRYGFVLTRHRMYLFGICAECREPSR